MTFVLCSSPLDEGECYVQYGPSSQDLGPPIQGPLNSSFPLPLMEASTTYYYQVTINSTLNIQFKGTFTTGECMYTLQAKENNVVFKFNFVESHCSSSLIFYS